MRCPKTLAFLPALALLFSAAHARAEETVVPTQPNAAPPAVAATPPPAGSEMKENVLIGPGVHHGFYGGPEAKVTMMTGDYAVLAGGQLGWVVNQHYVLGVGGYGLATAHSPEPALSSPLGTSRVGFGYGGVRLAYVFKPEKLVHVSLGALIGGGGVTAMTRDRTYDTDGDYSDRWRPHHGAAVFVAEPQTDLELNVHRNVRLAFTASYRFVSSTDYPGFKASDLSGPAAGLGVRIGAF